MFHPKQSVLVVAWSGHASSEVALCIENETPNHCLLGLSTIQGNHSTLWSVCFYSAVAIATSCDRRAACEALAFSQPLQLELTSFDKGKPANKVASFPGLFLLYGLC